MRRRYHLLLFPFLLTACGLAEQSRARQHLKDYTQGIEEIEQGDNEAKVRDIMGGAGQKEIKGNQTAYQYCALGHHFIIRFTDHKVSGTSQYKDGSQCTHLKSALFAEDHAESPAESTTVVSPGSSEQHLCNTAGAMMTDPACGAPTRIKIEH